MDPSYETVLDTRELVWTGLVYGIHAAIVLFHITLACYLIATGAHHLFVPSMDGPWLRRLGSSLGATPWSRHLGAARLLLGVALLAPLALGAPTTLSAAASVGALALLLFAEGSLAVSDRAPGRLVRFAAIGFAALCGSFMLWEGEDNLTLGADLLIHAAEWRNEELGWQLALDAKSPKVGDIAPDFELQDPEGRAMIRLSDFRGKRPVALVFGSYT